MLKSIQQLHFFDGLDKTKLDVLCSTARVREYNASEIMTYEEDDLERVFFLLEGEAKFYKVDRYDNEVFLYTLSENSLLTNIGSLDDNTIACFSNIEFLSGSKVISFDMTSFKQLVKSENCLLQNLVNALSLQKQKMDCTINMGMVYDGTAKVANMLYNQTELFNSLKKQEIAYRLNIQPATLSRILAKMLRKEIIEEIDHKIHICNDKELFGLFHT